MTTELDARYLPLEDVMAVILGQELKDRLLRELLTEHRWASSQLMFTAAFNRAWQAEVQPTLDEANRFLAVPVPGGNKDRS